MLSERVRSNSEAAPWVVDEIKQLEAEIERLREALRECARPFKGTLPDWESAARALTDELQRRVNIAGFALKQKDVSQMTRLHDSHAQMSDDKGQIKV